jgi:hypothetical protein
MLKGYRLNCVNSRAASFAASKSTECGMTELSPDYKDMSNPFNLVDKTQKSKKFIRTPIKTIKRGQE